MPQAVIKWNFFCDHEVTQYFAGADAASTATQNSTLMCPAWTENDIQAQALIREHEDLDRKKEEVARDQEKNAVILYQAQAAFMKKQMEDAGSDEEFKAECKKMLENCKILWAGKVRTAESKGENKQSELPSAGSLLELWAAKIKSADDKISLLLDAECVLRDREFRTHGNSVLYKNRRNVCAKWSKIHRLIRELGQKLDENTTLKQLGMLEGGFAKQWNWAVELMKDESERLKVGG
jgi:hypothetical protein